jgi:hypothetical protein
MWLADIILQANEKVMMLSGEAMHGTWRAMNMNR